ncbi:MAG: YggS family pyridoxal phosphate-dependent enzyme [Candidatus Omnitrophica bacterium]|nr:YggS family pyridoxal phosphate-dependent enzyme [Candidatus Omnitrophota bacterium]MCM8793467.1 YggS family pyridoxal phosphate-dependent enzyme [Candidatus Omnitrophota bacterium]
MLKENLAKVKAKIAEACRRVDRDPGEITLVCVTKGVEIEKIKEVVSLGIMDIGENRVQEAFKKYNELQTTGYKLTAKIRWHMVGHLQSNKAKYAVRIFDLIHSVDSFKLAEEINKQAERINKIQDILIQVNTSGEKTKFGIEPKGLFSLIGEIKKFKNLSLKGLMTIAPVVLNPEDARPYFRKLKELFDEFNYLTNHPLTILSMGMSQDFEVAIEEGANMVRIGRAIFKGSK